MKPNVLFLAHRVPYPPNRGDRIRSWQMLQYLAQRANVYLGALSDEPISGETRRVLARHSREMHLVEMRPRHCLFRAGEALWRGQSISEVTFRNSELQQAVVRLSAAVPFDAAVVFCSSMFPYVDAQAWRNVPRLVDLIDVDSQKWEDYAQSAHGVMPPVYRREARLLRGLERRIVERADAVTVTTGAEARLLLEHCPRANPCLLGNGVDQVDAAMTSREPISGRLAFVGVLNYRPNVEGICWFAREAWPQIRRKLGHASLEIVGQSPVKAVQRLARLAGVSVQANVPDVKAHLAAAEVVIAPLAIARGVQNKALEAMAMGRAVIASPAVCKGLLALAGEEIVRADGVSEWRESIVELLTNPTKRQRISTAGARYVAENHNWDNCLAPLGAWLDKVVGRVATSASAVEMMPA
jgi:sugar transferase (PEP-CTERM/EpsH1 system associated)